MRREIFPKSSCCGGVPAEVVQVDIFGDGRTIGLVGLRTIFEQLYAMGRTPDALDEAEVVKMVAAQNYVPAQAAASYGAALRREYSRFYSRKEKQISK
jgi:hypothetical protein